MIQNSGLKARETKIKIARMYHGARKYDSVRIAIARYALHFWPPRIRQAEHFCHLIKRFTYGIVLRFAECAPFLHIFHYEQYGMPSAH